MKSWALTIGGIAAVLGFILLSLWNAHREGYASGYATAKLECTEAALRSAATRKAERQVDQDRISKLEADYLAERVQSDYLKTLADVNAAYEAERQDEKASTSGNDCPSGISERMRDVIDGAGRRSR